MGRAKIAKRPKAKRKAEIKPCLTTGRDGARRSAVAGAPRDSSQDKLPLCIQHATCGSCSHFTAGSVQNKDPLQPSDDTHKKCASALQAANECVTVSFLRSARYATLAARGSECCHQAALERSDGTLRRGPESRKLSQRRAPRRSQSPRLFADCG